MTNVLKTTVDVNKHVLTLMAVTNVVVDWDMLLSQEIADLVMVRTNIIIYSVLCSYTTIYVYIFVYLVYYFLCIS